MKTGLQILLFLTLSDSCFADRIYIMNSPGYNTAEVQLINAIIANGHTVNSSFNTTSLGLTLPPGFTSACVDSVNGYDWLCFFGDISFTPLAAQVQSFIDAGGKVFYQYEVTCCTAASTSVASMLSTLTGLSITPNSNSYIAVNTQGAGWDASLGCCSLYVVGNAYKGLDNLPPANQFIAGSNLGGSTPPISTCPNFGFFFTTTDFVTPANKGAITGLGDVNIWYDGDEPFGNSGTTPINMTVVDYFFPNSSSTCYLFPPGCLETYSPSGSVAVNLGVDTTLCEGDSLVLDAGSGNTSYLWQDGSTGSGYTVTQPGLYWVQTANACGSGSDSINVLYNQRPVVDLGLDTILCEGKAVTLYGGTASWHVWSSGSSDSILVVSVAGNYWVLAGNGNCSASDTVHVQYENCEAVILFPNVFTPNNDGSNDTFIPLLYEGITRASLIIFNRWGREVFQTDEPLKGWDGRSGNSLCSDGTYYWIVRYETIHEEPSDLTGTVTILK